jgi:hypothetical protein
MLISLPATVLRYPMYCTRPLPSPHLAQHISTRTHRPSPALLETTSMQLRERHPGFSSALTLTEVPFRVVCMP